VSVILLVVGGFRPFRLIVTLVVLAGMATIVGALVGVTASVDLFWSVAPVIVAPPRFVRVSVAVS